MPLGPLRRLAAASIGIGLAWAAPAPLAEAALQPDGAPVLAGVARDALGAALSGVEILVLSDRPQAGPVALGTTGPDGRFAIAGLPRGTYRVAAVKEGYLASLSRVNTFWGTALEVVLRPLPREVDPGVDRILDGPEWILRLPRRSLLREVDLVSVLAPAGEVPAAETSTPTRVPASLQGELVHRVALADLDGRAAEGSVEGTETRMELASLVGTRANLRVQGERESLAAGAGYGEFSGGARQRASAFSVDVSLDAGANSSLDVNAFYADRTLALETGTSTAGPGERHGHRAWGYDATWATQLDAASRLAVQMDYVDQAIAVRGLDALAETLGGSTNRALGAETSYEALAGDDHLVRLGVRAQVVDLALPLVRGGTSVLGVPGAAGWSVAVDVEDAWSPWAGATVVYGLGVQQTFDDRGSTWVVPRLGGAWSGESVRLRGVVSYHGVARGEETGSDLLGASTPAPIDHPVGYEIELESPVPGGVTVLAGYRDRPMLPVALGLRPRADETEFYVTNGDAAERRAFLSIDRAGSAAAVSFKLEAGDARGLVAESGVVGLPYRLLADREIEFRAATAAIRAQRTGTTVALRVVRVEESGGEPFPAAPSLRRYVDAEFLQDLVRFGALDATCRLIVAARMATGGESERDRTLLALERRVSAGLALAF